VAGLREIAEKQLLLSLLFAVFQPLSLAETSQGFVALIHTLEKIAFLLQNRRSVRIAFEGFQIRIQKLDAQGRLSAVQKLIGEIEQVLPQGHFLVWGPSQFEDFVGFGQGLAEFLLADENQYDFMLRLCETEHFAQFNRLRIGLMFQAEGGEREGGTADGQKNDSDRQSGAKIPGGTHCASERKGF
jgi:hypothetical protein